MRYLITALLFLGFATVAASTDESIATIGKLTIIHGNNLSPEDEEFVKKEVKSHQYKTSTMASEIGERVRYALQRRGYFKVFVHDPVVAVLSKETYPEIVDVKVNIDEGDIYRLKNIGFTNTLVFTPPELRSQFQIADGDIFDRDKIAAGLEGLRRLYVSKGYSNFAAVPETELNNNTHTVALVVHLDEGAHEGNPSNRQ